jgi:formylglycine-generating enzyme required for sulfatase activity
MPHDAFISYSQKDKNPANAVVAHLEREGIRCWIAPRDVIPGANWANAIVEAINDSRVMVIVFSSNANASEHVRREIELAVKRGIPVLPLRIEDVLPQGDLEFFLSSSHWMDAISPPIENHIAQLAEKLQLLLASDEQVKKTKSDSPVASPAAPRPSTSAEVVAPPSDKRRARRYLIAALIIAIVAIGTLAVILGSGENARKAEVQKASVSNEADHAGVPDSTNQGSSLPSKAGELWSNTLNMKFAYIPEGNFTMGTPAREPGRNNNEFMHPVKISRSFLMQTTTVTVDAFSAFVKDRNYQTDAERHGFVTVTFGNNRSETRNGYSWKSPGFQQRGDHPVVCVSWNDAKAFCEWLSQKENRTYRLPTEAEWEYAARAGTYAQFFSGNNPASLELCGWFRANSGSATHPVGQKAANPWKLYDMNGNVRQWCEDWAGPYNGAMAVVDPKGAATGKTRVLRGGSWNSTSVECRNGNREAGIPENPGWDIGFRVVMDLPT